MQWWGKVAGGALGLLMGGPLGAALGAAVGHQIDRGLEDELGDDLARPRSTPPDIFFSATFGVMGHVAKADGRVSETEIATARAVMKNMRLDDAKVREAISYFTAGKRPDFPLESTVAALRRAYYPRHDTLRTFVEIQVHAAMADGAISTVERDLLRRICRKLGISDVELGQIEALARLRSSGGGRRNSVQPVNQLEQAYRLLEVPASASDAAVKKAYRRMMNKHHPDKAIARGLPESMQQVAHDKTQQIREAYDTIRTARGT
ncbi:MAG: co-chaperone DjlA [Pseudomonadota bacterium]